jgi:hypothetical protein
MFGLGAFFFNYLERIGPTVVSNDDPHVFHRDLLHFKHTPAPWILCFFAQPLRRYQPVLRNENPFQHCATSLLSKEKTGCSM